MPKAMALRQGGHSAAECHSPPAPGAGATPWPWSLVLGRISGCRRPDPDQRGNLRATSVPFAPALPLGITYLVFSFPRSEPSFSYIECTSFVLSSPQLSDTLSLPVPHPWKPAPSWVGLCVSDPRAASFLVSCLVLLEHTLV